MVLVNKGYRLEKYCFSLNRFNKGKNKSIMNFFFGGGGGLKSRIVVPNTLNVCFEVFNPDSFIKVDALNYR